MKHTEQRQFFNLCMYTALMDLMKEMEFPKISIELLCKRAGVSRMTYYRYYSNKEEILMNHLDESFTCYLSELQSTKDLQIEDALETYFIYVSSTEKPFFLAVVTSGLSYLLMDKFYDYIDQVMLLVYRKEHLSPYIRSYLTGGTYKLTIDWIKNGLDLSPNEMVDVLRPIVTKTAQ